MAWWESNHYQSFCLPSEESESEDLEEQEDESSAQLDHEESDSTSIMYVSGDVTHPQAGAEDAIIVHCIGRRGWGPSFLMPRTGDAEAEPSPGVINGLCAALCGQNRSVNFRIRRHGFDSCLLCSWLSNAAFLGLNCLVRMMGEYLRYPLHRVFKRVNGGNVCKTNESLEKKQNPKHISPSLPWHFLLLLPGTLCPQGATVKHCSHVRVSERSPPIASYRTDPQYFSLSAFLPCLTC